MQNRPRTIRAIMGINGKPRSRRPSARRAHRSCLGAPIITHRSAGDAVNCSSAAIKSRCWHRLLGIPDCCCSPCSGSETGKPQCPSRRNVEDKMVCIESAPKHHCPVSFAVPCSVSLRRDRCAEGCPALTPLGRSARAISRKLIACFIKKTW